MPTEPQRVTDPTAVAQPARPGQPTQALAADGPAQPAQPENADVQRGKKARKPPCADFGADEDACLQPERIATFLGFDRQVVPQQTTGVKASPEQAMRWLYLTSNLRWVGVYLQAAAGRGSPDYRWETNSDHLSKKGVRQDRGWMNAFPMIDASGWGTACIYNGFCALWLPHGRNLDAALGRLNARHAKSLLGLLTDSLGLSLAGAVVYVDNEDVAGAQAYKDDPNDEHEIPKCHLNPAKLADYLGYFQAFAAELMTARDGEPAYRFGLYAHPATIRQIAAVVPTLFVWQVSMPEKPAWSELLADDDGTVPLTIEGVQNWSPRRQSDGVEFRFWPVMRQFALDMKFVEAGPRVAGGDLPLDDKKTIDFDSSFVLDPSEPFANPRLAYIPGSNLLIRQRSLLARYKDGPTQWRTTVRTYRRRGSLSIRPVPGDLTINPATVLLPPIPNSGSGEELHPDSPVAAARDGCQNFYAATIRLDRGVLVGQVILGQTTFMELVPDSQARRPLALALAATRQPVEPDAGDSQDSAATPPVSGAAANVVAVAYPSPDHRACVHLKAWPAGNWQRVRTDANVLHPLGGMSASADAGSTCVFLAGVGAGGDLWTGLVTDLGASPPKLTAMQAASPGSQHDPILPTSAVAAASPGAGEHLAFAITSIGKLLVVPCTETGKPPTGGTQGNAVQDSSKAILHPHSRLGVCVEAEDRVHVGGIDVEGNVRRWVVRKTGGLWVLGQSIVDAKGKPQVPNPWTDIALTAGDPGRGVDKALAVAGVDDTTEDPERRAMAYATSLRGDGKRRPGEFQPVPNPE